MSSSESSATPNPRGVHVMPSERIGYLIVTVTDSFGVVLCKSEFVSEWWDQETAQLFYAYLDRSDPDARPSLHTARVGTMPVSDAAVLSLAVCRERTQRRGRDRGVA